MFCWCPSVVGEHRVPSKTGTQSVSWGQAVAEKTLIKSTGALDSLMAQSTALRRVGERKVLVMLDVIPLRTVTWSRPQIIILAINITLIKNQDITNP